MGDARTRLITDIRLAEEGRQEGFLYVPVSTNESAYGRISIPIVSVKNGDGPRALLLAGNHGDEYEGQIALLKLTRELQPGTIRGQVIILPGANFPAVEAGQRNSPIDGGNLNRSFPGDPDGAPTAMIAHYIESVLLPACDYALDLHSGGSSLVYIPCALIRISADAARTRRMFEMLHAFGAPVGYVSDGRNGGADRTLSAAAERCGVACITTELGGGGTVQGEALRLAEHGLRRFLHHLDILRVPLAEPPQRTRLLTVHGFDYYVFAPEGGLVEPLAELGDSVEPGQTAAAVYFPDTPWRSPALARFKAAGVVICRRTPGIARRGDCLYQIAADFSGG